MDPSFLFGFGPTHGAGTTMSDFDALKPSNAPMLRWDDTSDPSQILTATDLFGIPQIEVPSQKDKLLSDYRGNFGSSLLSNPLFRTGLFGNNEPQPLAIKSPTLPDFSSAILPFTPNTPGLTSEPPRIDLDSPFTSQIKLDSTSSNVTPSTATPTVASPQPATAAKKKGKRKKGRPELQRKKRGEMNERFKALKQLCQPEASASTIIGRGDRSTNSKEAILRIATNRISRFKKEIANLEKEVAVKRAAKPRRSTPSGSVSPSSQASSTNSSTKTASRRSSPQVDSLSGIDFANVFAGSSLARLVTTLDGSFLAANDLCAEMLDLTPAEMRTLRHKDTVFTLAHPETLPRIFNNLSVLLGGSQPVAYIIDGKGPVTRENRIPVFSCMSWLTHSDGVMNPKTNRVEGQILMESVLVHTGWATPTESDLIRPSALLHFTKPELAVSSPSHMLAMLPTSNTPSENSDVLLG